jgi:hypothetical protein
VLSPSVFKNPSYSFYVPGASMASLSIYGVQTFGVTYATSKGIRLDVANYT